MTAMHDEAVCTPSMIEAAPDDILWVRSYTCLPRVAIEADCDLGDSVIQRLSFEQWLELEGQSNSAAYDKLNRRYEQRLPVFWRKALPVPDRLLRAPDPEHTRAFDSMLHPALSRLMLALHWFTGVAPIDPARSVTYFDPRSSENEARIPGLAARVSTEGVPRRYGESSKGYVTENRQAAVTVVRAADESALRAMLAFVERTERVWSSREYSTALQSLAAVATDGLGWSMRLLLLVSAGEGLLVPDRRSGVERAFTTRLACMLARDHADVARWMTWIGPAYALRSDVIHGRALTRLDDVAGGPEEYVVALHRAVIVVLCRLVAYQFSHAVDDVASDALWSLLDAAPTSASAFDRLTDALTDAASHQIHQFAV